jgi:hypothetical protein
MEIAYKNKKDLLDELKIYKQMVLKKLSDLDLISALYKTKSAITLIKENQAHFSLDDELFIFDQLNQKIINERQYHRDKYLRRYDNLLRENLTELNLENFSKLLAMLKEEIDEYNDKFGLHDIQDSINDYFSYIKKMYVILCSYRVLEFKKASTEILRFAQEIKNVNFNNLKALTLCLYRELISEQLNELSKIQKRASINELSQRLDIVPENLVKVITLISETPRNPIKKFNQRSQEIYFH